MKARPEKCSPTLVRTTTSFSKVSINDFDGESTHLGTICQAILAGNQIKATPLSILSKS